MYSRNYGSCIRTFTRWKHCLLFLCSFQRFVLSRSAQLDTTVSLLTSSPFAPFAAVSLFGVAGLAETFPFFSVSGPFLLDFPGFQVPSDSIFPSQLWSSSRALPLHFHFCNCSDVFSFSSPFDVSKPFQPSPSHNRRYRFHLCFFQYLLISPVL